MCNITDWLISVGTISLAVVAIFQDKIRAWLTRPRLSISINTAPPDCHKTTLVYNKRFTSSWGGISPTSSGAPNLSWDSSSFGTVFFPTYKKIDSELPSWSFEYDETDCYYFRVRVKNYGNQRAELVEVYAKELSKKHADGTFKKINNFLPMNLVWSHVKTPFIDAISPNMEKFCDLGHIIDPTKRSKIQFEDNPDWKVPSGKTIFSFDLEVRPFTMSHLIPPGIYRLVLQIAAANTKPIEKTLEIVITGDWHEDESKMLSEGVGIKLI